MRFVNLYLIGYVVFVLGDEVYEHMVFDGAPHASLLRNDVLYARSFVVSSFGKTYHATGWKIGYCIAPASLTNEFRKVHQFVQFSVATPLQAAIADFLVECSVLDVDIAAVDEIVAAEMRRIGARHGDVGLVEHSVKGRDVLGVELRGIGIRDVAGNKSECSFG